MPESHKRYILKLKLDLIKYKNLIDQVVNFPEIPFRNYICFANVHMLIEAYNKKSVSVAVNSAGYVVTDGVPLIAALRLLYGIKQERIAGMDFMPDLMKIAEKNGEAVFFYGSTENTLQEIERKAKIDFPDLRITGLLSPPFRQLSAEENQKYIQIINNSGAKYIFVGLGCPKQELWMAANHEKINGFLLGVGAAFEVYAGLKRMAPQWMRRTGTEWIYRLIQDPKRLFKRYLLTNTTFVLLMVIEFFRIRIFNTGKGYF